MQINPNGGGVDYHHTFFRLLFLHDVTYFITYQLLENQTLFCFFTLFWVDLEGASSFIPPPHSSYIQKPSTIRVNDAHDILTTCEIVTT